MSRPPKASPSGDGATSAVSSAADTAPTDQEAGAAGGSAARECYAVLVRASEGLPAGVVVLGSSGRIGDLVASGDAREASARDVRLAGHNVHTLS